MRITVDLDSATPQYEQLRQQVAALVLSGELAEGDRLPTVRALATDLGIAAGTVARAYRDLEAAGVVATRRRVGTVVTAAAPTPRRTREAVQGLVALAAREGLTAQEVLDLVRSELLAVAHDDQVVARTSA
ncbi:GntR family transcriptional regulator [Cellulomonas algicola]|uniref:GntR family transcriptional regulator n=1 Tax=Cellulomonas algicola TaxID=2071633 RepID=A0A401V4M8_9CELL|nr:GntR family transcriptional regulator [Cellulomonas algicola]GCD21852.1 GntR family transcriptional regulator [Cellulomonas algicola]